MPLETLHYTTVNISSINSTYAPTRTIKKLISGKGVVSDI